VPISIKRINGTLSALYCLRLSIGTVADFIDSYVSLQGVMNVPPVIAKGLLINIALQALLAYQSADNRYPLSNEPPEFL
jgi:hypothetical protein